MPRRLFVLAASLFFVAMTLRAESPGAHELTLGRQSLARRDYGTAAEHLATATAALDPEKERDALADAWLQLGIADLTGLDRPEEALAAFRKSAELSGNPSAWLWASTAAERLGHAEEARDYKARAIGSPRPQVTLEAAPAPPPPPKSPEIIPGPTPPEPAPVVQAAPPPVSEPAPERAAEKKPDAFQHFFGPKEPAAPPAAAPAEAAPVEPVKKGDAFQHLFGESSPERPAGAREAQEQAPAKEKATATEKKPVRKPELKPEKKKVEEKAPAAQAATPKGGAFQHFFGEKKKDGQAGDESNGEKKDRDEGDKKTPEESRAPPPR